MSDSPASDVDLFADAALRDPFPVYRALRDAGPAVRLTRYGVRALTRHRDVRAALTTPSVFTVEGGLALTREANETIMAGTVLGSDGPDHVRLRRPLSRRLNRRAVSELRSFVQERADGLVARHVSAGRFDAVELARDLVTDVVMELMGLPSSTRDQVLAAAAATFDCFGPDNARYRSSAPEAAANLEFLATRLTPGSVRPGSWLDALHRAADDGEIRREDVTPLMNAYVTAGMDTTIAALSTALHLLAEHPAQWQQLRDGALTPQDVLDETLRLEAPVQGFGRRLLQPFDIDGTRIEAGEQVWVLYGAAGRDPHKWGPTADEFRAGRPGAAEHLALGAGVHLCGGNHLVNLEAHALLTALTRHCVRITPDGAPVRVLNNVLRGHSRIPLTAERAG